MFNDANILNTGGTGSFGKQYAKTLLKRDTPGKIIIYSRDELKQFEMQQEFPQECMRFFIGDVHDRDRLVMAMRGVNYIRPGEKLHEMMCPQDDSHVTLEFEDHYVIQATIRFWDGNGHAYETNALSEKGRPVEQGFEYNSGTNPHYFSVEEIRAFNHLAAVK